MGVAKKWVWSLFQKWRQVKLCSQCLKVTPPTLRYKFPDNAHGITYSPPTSTLFNLILNVGTEQVRSEFSVDPGIINKTFLPNELQSLIRLSDGLLSNWLMNLFHNELALNTKLFIEINQLAHQSSLMCKLP